MRFLNLVQPNIAVFMRYDIWPNMIWNLKEKKIPCLLVDATMRENTARKWILAKSFHKSLYSCITKILTVSKIDMENFKEFKISPDKIKSVGDTRFDRVYQKSLQAKEKKLFKDDFFKGKKVFVFGSSWESDEEVVLPAILKLMKYDPDVVSIIAPHEPTVEHLEQLENTISGKMNYIRFSLLNDYKNERIIIIDSIGVLLTLYSYADVVFVGGSFKQGIHNVLEPAVYGIPVLFGPKHENSQEAVSLKQIGGAFVINNRKQAYRNFRRVFGDSLYRKTAGKICSEFVKENIGATARILEEINQYI
jgi:3-deoxy-D-manno-octulosonic-acid transferase